MNRYDVTIRDNTGALRLRTVWAEASDVDRDGALVFPQVDADPIVFVNGQWCGVTGPFPVPDASRDAFDAL